MTKAKKPQPRVFIRARGDAFDWLVVGRNGAKVARSPGLYTTRSHARRGGVNFSERYLKIRKVEVVETGLS